MRINGGHEHEREKKRRILEHFLRTEREGISDIIIISKASKEVFYLF